MKKQRKTIYDFMLQGSLYETLTSKINRLGNFSYLTCVDIILSGGPSNAPSFLFKAWNTSSIFCLPSCALYFSPVIWFVFVQISCFLIFFCGTHRVDFFLPQPVQLLFWILPHREYLFIFYLPGSKSVALQLGVHLILLYFIRIWSWVRRPFFPLGVRA